jgi:uncharacterized protein
MRYVALFEDTPEMAPVRKARVKEHIAFLEANRAEIVIAGGLRDEHGGEYRGGLWVLEVESRARAVALIESDPYFSLYPRPYQLYAWGKALPQFSVTL